MKIGVASDHRGYRLKETIIKYTKEKGYDVIDFGTTSEEITDYPIYAKMLCKEIDKKIEKGILICGTGIGMSITANKIKGIRCAKVTNAKEAHLAREHNNANVLALGEDIKEETLLDILNEFLETPFSSVERYKRRVREITEIENEC